MLTQDIEYDLTAEDIDGAQRLSPTECPLARMLNRLRPGMSGIPPSPSGASAEGWFWMVGPWDARLWLNGAVAETLALQPSARDFLDRYDAPKPVGPCRVAFTLAL